MPKQKIKKQMQIIINCNQKNYLQKPRPEYKGEISESDACKDYWSSSSYEHLHAVYDPTVKQLKVLDLGKEATTHHDDQMLEIMLKQRALPRLCRGDSRSSFVINKKDAGTLAYKDGHPQLGFALNIWGVTMENHGELVFKGGIARTFRTMQSQ